jgi:pheromone shutdown protein TraB
MGATVVLGDRLYSVTVQRAFDRLRGLERLRLLIVLFFEFVTMSSYRVRRFIKKSESEVNFIENEIRKFNKILPSFADVIINERDEYLAQTVCEISRLCSAEKARRPSTERRCVVAVIGAGHLGGVTRHLEAGGVPLNRVTDISSSSKQNATWPGVGRLQVVDTTMLYDVDLRQ